MDINSVYGSTGASFVESVYGQKARTTPEESRGGVSSPGADSVTISAEAKEMLASVTAEKSGEENTGNGDESGAASGGGGGGGSSDDSDSKIQSLKARLASLQASLSQASGYEAAGISAQIGQVIGEIAALEAETAA